MAAAAARILHEFIKVDQRPTFILHPSPSASPVFSYSNTAFASDFVSRKNLPRKLLGTIAEQLSALPSEPEKLRVQVDATTFDLWKIEKEWVGVVVSDRPGPKEAADHKSSKFSTNPSKQSPDGELDDDDHQSLGLGDKLAISSPGEQMVYNERNDPRIDWTRGVCPMATGNNRDHYKLLHSIAWDKTDLGPISSWSVSTRVNINTIMHFAQPACIYYGPRAVGIYNTAWRDIIAQDRHPKILGTSFIEGWPDAFDLFMPLIKRVWAGETIKQESTLFLLNRTVPREEVFFDFIASPMVDNDGFPQGAFVHAIIVTEDIRRKRHAKVLRQLSSNLATTTSRDFEITFWSSVLESLDCDPTDSPFVILYQANGRKYEYKGSRGLCDSIATSVDLDGQDAGVSSVFRDRLRKAFNRKTYVVEPFSDLEAETLRDMPYRGYGDCQDAILVPVLRPGETAHAVLIIGQNLHRPFDSEYEELIGRLQTILTVAVAKIWTAQDSEKRKLEGQLNEMARIHSLEIKETLNKKTKQLRESESLFEKTAASVPVGLVSIDTNGSIVYANAAWYRFCGLSPGDSMDDWEGSLYPEDRDRIVNGFKKVVAEHGSMSEEFRCGIDPTPGSRGYNYWCRNTLDPSFDEDGKFTGWFCTLVDITSIKRAEEYQRQLTSEAVERKRQQDNFIDVYGSIPLLNLPLKLEANVTSHELRNPLSAILQSADEIQVTIDNLQDLHTHESSLKTILEAAETILACGEHQKKIIDDILNVSKMDAGLLTVEPIPTQPHEIVRRGLQMFVPELKSKGIDSGFSMSKTYLTECADSWWLVDPARLTQILINLVTNAIKFTSQKEGERTINVHLDASRTKPSTGDNFQDSVIEEHDKRALTEAPPPFSSNGNPEDAMYLHVQVKDTGIGISKEWQKALGQRFQQAPKTHVSYGGSGLGLFIARRLSYLLGGELHFDSDLGVGSTFSFFVFAPRCSSHTDVKTHDGISSRPATFTRQRTRDRIQTVSSGPREKKGNIKLPHTKEKLGEGYRVLVVEDNILNQRILRRQLDSQGCETSVANNGLEAVKLVEKGERFTVILMDMEMPVMDGGVATQHIRNLEKSSGLHVPIIGTSANARSQQIEQMIAAGMDSVITKPFLILDLMRKIQDVLEPNKSAL